MTAIFEFLQSTTGLAVLAVGLATVISLLYWGRDARQALQAAFDLITTQHVPASQELIDGLIDHGEQQGEKEFVQAELAAIRRRYGHDGVRRGHLMFIFKKLDGSVERNAQAPSFGKGSPKFEQDL